MNGATQRPSARRMLFDGRIEKRIPMAVQVYLERTKEPRASEKALTENVSPHGARVRTKQVWQPGEESLITPLASDFPQLARVVYCQAGANGSSCVGVEFEGRPVKWGDWSAGKLG
jgi:PilZ domain